MKPNDAKPTPKRGESGGHGRNPTPPPRGEDNTTGQERSARGEHLRKERAPSTNLDRNKPTEHP